MRVSARRRYYYHREKRWLSADDLRPIDTAPHDGSVITVTRIYNDEVVSVNQARWAVRHPDAPARCKMPPDPLGRTCVVSDALEQDMLAHIDDPTWTTVDRMYRVPAPTHWLP